MMCMLGKACEIISVRPYHSAVGPVCKHTGLVTKKNPTKRARIHQQQ